MAFNFCMLPIAFASTLRRCWIKSSFVGSCFRGRGRGREMEGEGEGEVEGGGEGG